MKLTQIMNETTRRSNDFFNDSKHGKAIYKLLGGKPFRASVVKDYLERILGKLGDVKGIRAIEFIGKNVGIDSRKYDNKPTRDFIFAVMDGIEALYKSHLDESVAKKTITENKENRPLSNEVKKHFLEIVSTYNKYQEMMDRKSDLATVAETLGGITEAARTLAIHEGDDWFDKHTIKRNMSELDKLGKEFDKCAKEATSLDQRLGGLYEDMGNILSRYYKMGEITEEQMKDRLGMNESVGCGCGGTTESTCGCGTHTHESINEGKFKVDDLVYNKKTKTVGIVRIGDDKYGEVKTDADGNVDVDELEKYNPIKFKHQAKAKAAPSTEKEINKRGLFNPFKNESVNESASKEAMGIAGFTGTRGSAVEDFITKNELNGKKLFNFIRKGSLKDRMDFVTAIAGNPGNKIQKMIISKFKLGESVVNEGMKPSQVRSAISKVKKGLMRKWKQKGGYENFGQKELSQMKDKFDYNAYGDKDERDISHMLDAFDNWAMNYDGNMRESVNEEKLKPKKLTQLKKGEKFVFNNTPYEFVELYTDINNAAKVKTQDGKTSVVSFGGGMVNKNTKGGFGDYLKQGGRVWDNVNPTNSSSLSEAKFGYKDSTASYINNHKDEFKVAEKMNKGNEVKFYDSLSQMEEKIGHPKFMIFLSNALRGYKVDMYKDPKIKNPQDAQEALFLLSK